MSKSSKTEYELNLSGFSGGLNLRDADYCLGSTESPQMQNMLWRNGFLASRIESCVFIVKHIDPHFIK